jgi:hypothetical protein
MNKTCSRDNTVGIATVYGLDGLEIGVRVPVASRIFSSPRCRDRRWGPTQPSSQGAPGTLSSEVKRPGREADHSAPTSVEVKKICIYTSIPPYVSMA